MADYVALETTGHVLLEDGTSGLLLETSVPGYTDSGTVPLTLTPSAAETYTTHIYTDSGTIRLSFGIIYYEFKDPTDNFNRANGALGSNWTYLNEGIPTPSDMPEISSNRMVPKPTAPHWSAAYWNPQTFGPDTEVYVTLPTAGDTWVFARLDVSSTYATGYYARAYAADPTYGISIGSIDSGGATPLGLVPQAWSAGDQLMLRVSGDQISAWARTPPGDWYQVVLATDSTFTSAGYAGVMIYDGTVDDFNAHAYVAPPPPSPTTDAATAILRLTPSVEELYPIAYVDSATAHLGFTPITEHECVTAFLPNFIGYESTLYSSVAVKTYQAEASNQYVAQVTELAPVVVC